MSLLYSLLPQYSRNLDIREDFGVDGQGGTLDLYLRSLDSEIYEVISKSIGVLLTFSNIDDVEDKYLPYIGYTLGYDWNYYLSTDIQRNLLKNILDIYKRKGTKFSIHFSLYQLDSNVSMVEPYADIYTLDRSGLDFNSDSIQLFSKTFKNDIKKIEIDSDDYVYVLSNNIIFKIDSNHNKLMYKFKDENDNIIDIVVEHNDIQKDYLYYITKKDVKYIIKKIKLFNIDNDNYNITALNISFNPTSEVKFLSIDNENNLLITTKNKVYSINTNSNTVEEIIDLSDDEHLTDCEINKVIINSDNDIILSHSGKNEIGYSHSFLKKYQKISNSNVSYDKTFDFVFGYDSEYSGNVEINDIQFDMDNVYCVINNKYVFKIGVDNDTEVVSDIKDKVATYDDLPTMASVGDIYYVIDEEVYYRLTSDNEWENINEYILTTDNDFVSSDIYSELYYNIDTITAKDTVSSYSDLEEITNKKINDIYKVEDENCYYKWLNKWVKIYTTNNKDIVLNKNEYPDNTCLELRIYDKDENELNSYSFNEDLKTITLNDSLSSSEEITVKVSEYNIINSYEFINEKIRYIYLTDSAMETINTYGLMVYFNYNGVNGELLVPEIDYVLDRNEQFVYIKRDNLSYGTIIGIYSNISTSYIDPSDITKNTIKYKYTLTKLQPDVVIEKVEDVEIENNVANQFMTCNVVDSINDVLTGGSLYKIKNTNDYYYYNSDSELVHNKFDICVFYNNGLNETYVLVDDENNIESKYRAYRKVATEDGVKVYYIYLKRYNASTESYKEVLIDDQCSFKIKKLFDFNLITNKTINKDYIDSTLVLNEEQRPYNLYNILGFGINIYLNNSLLSSDNYTFDENTNTIQFNSNLLNQKNTDNLSIDIYNYEYKIYSIGIDNINNISDYIAIGFDKCFRVYTKSGNERHSYNTLLPINNIISKLDNDKIYFIKNKNTIDYMMCSFENGGVLTSKDYYSNGILVLKTNCASDVLSEAIEYVRPAGWKIIIENSQSLVYNLNSKTYKKLKYQKEVTSNEKSTTGYPDTISEYEYISGTLYIFSKVTPNGNENPYELNWFEKNSNGDYIGSTDTIVSLTKTYYSSVEDSSDKAEIGYYKNNDLYRKNYTQRFSDIGPLKPNGNKINVYDGLDGQTRYYKEQLLDSIQYVDSSNGPISSICMVGQIYDIDNIAPCTELYLYDSIFDDVIIDEEIGKTTDNITMFRNPIGYGEYEEK